MDWRGARIAAHDLKFGAEHFVEHQRQVDAVGPWSCAAHTDRFVRLKNLVERLWPPQCHDGADRNAFARSPDPTEFARIKVNIRISQRLIQYEGAVPVSYG